MANKTETIEMDFVHFTNAKQNGQSVPCVMVCTDRSDSSDLSDFLKKHNDRRTKITITAYIPDINDDDSEMA